MKNTIFNSLKVGFVASILGATIFAGTVNSAGTAGGAQLLIPQGNLNIALSTANGSSVSGLNSIYVNPAGVANLSSMAGMASSGDYLADTQLTNLSFGMPINESTNMAVSLRTMDFGDIIKTTAMSTEGDGTTFSPSFLVANLALGRNISDRVKVGVVGKLVSETIEDVSATAMAADVGVQYKFPNDRLTVGVALKNLGSRLQYEGTGLEQQLTPDGTQPGTKDENFAMTSMDSPLPTSLDIAVGYVLTDGLTVMTSFENFSYQLNTLSFGAKYHKGNVWLAAGTKMNVQAGDKPTTLSETSWEDYTESNWGATLGFGVDLEMDATVVSISYAYRQSVEFFDDFSSVEVSFSF